MAVPEARHACRGRGGLSWKEDEHITGTHNGETALAALQAKKRQRLGSFGCRFWTLSFGLVPSASGLYVSQHSTPLNVMLAG